MGRMKDFDIRIRNGGDDAIAAVSEYVSHLERKNALLEGETALLPKPRAEAVDMLREQWQQLHKGPGPSPMIGVDLAEGESWTPQS